MLSRRRAFHRVGFEFRPGAAQNGPFLAKTAPKTRPSVLPLKTPQMRRIIRVNGTGVIPCESWGLISLPLADLPFGGFWICSTPPRSSYLSRTPERGHRRSFGAGHTYP